MSRSVFLSTRAQRDLDALSPIARRRIRDGLIDFTESGPGDLKKLKGVGGETDLYRLGIGEYRVVLATATGRIRVTRVIARGEGYDWL